MRSLYIAYKELLKTRSLYFSILGMCVLSLSRPQEVPKIKLVSHPNQAVSLALLDLKSIPDYDKPYIRYLWVADNDPNSAKMLSFAINTISRSPTIIRPLPLQKDKILLLRLDLRHYAPRDYDLKEWLSLWEDFQFDPRFSLLITKGALNTFIRGLKGTEGKGWVYGWHIKNVPPFEHKGETHTQKWVKESIFRGLSDLDLDNVDMIRLPSPGIDYQSISALYGYTNSQAPIIDSNYFLFRATSSIQDKGTYSIVYGGRYYQLAGIKKGAKKGTDEDVLLEDLGVGSVKNGITAKVIFEKLRSDQRAAIFRSGVTGSPRQMEFFRTLSSRLDIGSGLISITHDLKNQDIDIDTHPIANLLDFKDAAREVIWERQNGLHGYALFNGAGTLQDEAPPDVVKDHTIPSPFTARLQSSISCISCHETEGSDGWKRVTNDVKTLVGKNKADIFGDVSREKNSIQDTLDRLAGLYQGDPERALSRGRDDYALAVLKATGPWKESKSQTDIIKLTSTKLVHNWRAYWYDLISPRQALLELGIETEEKNATKVLNILLKPELRAGVPIPYLGDVIIPEDPRLAALKAGLSINRSDWDLAYSFALERTSYNIKHTKGLLK